MFGRDAEESDDLTFKRMTYADAIELLKPNGFPDLQWGDDLGAAEENRLTELDGPDVRRPTTRPTSSSSTCATTTTTPAW
ncbi:MAG: hypothetical protein WKG07_14290 [Hymenobacter sp.]